MSPLIGVTELAARLADPGWRVADCRWYLGEPERGRRAYHEGHVPGAVYVDLERDLSAPAGPGRHPLPDLADFADAMGRLGIGSEHTVVAYDDRGGAVAARLWWLLRHAGHASALVLDGGLAAWRAAGLPLHTEAPRHPVARLDAGPGAMPTVDRDELRAMLGAATVIDARAPERYRGDEEPIDPVAGHVPTAVNVPYEGNLGPDQRFRDPAALRDRYPDADGRTVVYCGSGVTACHDLLAMEVAGLAGGALYPGSWSDWSTAGYPVATGGETSG